MGKLVILFVLMNLIHTEINSNKDKTQAQEVREYEYLTTFSETYSETADYWKAESAGLEAESKAKDRTNIKEWLLENKENLNEKQTNNQC